MKIGLISDTHGHLDPRVLEHFSDVEHILHAGDIGPQSLVLQLENMAPVTAVLGNTDHYLPYPETEVVTLENHTFVLHHIVQPSALDASLERRIRLEKARVVVFGHTHKPFAEERDGVLFFNPGYAGKQRFDLRRSVATMTLDRGGMEHRFHDL